MLATRLATAAVVVPILLGIVWIGGPIFWLTAAATSAQSAREATALIVPNPGRLMRPTIVLASVGLVLAAVAGPTVVIAWIVLAFLIVISLSLLNSGSPPGSIDWVPALGTILYAGLPFSILVSLRAADGSIRLGSLETSTGAIWVLAVLTTTWAVDTFAFAFGRSIGKRAFSPRLSPKKTWEGTIGGVAAGMIVFTMWALLLGWSAVPAAIVGLGVASGVIVGDLAESAMKRSAGVKDAGNLFPGHGGMLDRVDGLAFSAAVVFLFKALGESLHVLGW